MDGRVSPARSYKYGAGFYTIGVLNEFSQRAFYDLWPRLDRMPGCPGQVREMVIRTLVGTRGGSAG